MPFSAIQVPMKHWLKVKLGGMLTFSLCRPSLVLNLKLSAYLETVLLKYVGFLF